MQIKFNLFNFSKIVGKILHKPFKRLKLCPMGVDLWNVNHKFTSCN
jgi:hypothetical protein